ncbi:hypothetical protein [Pseudobacter ginsenosidimutans]|uniref:Restriction endonuclease n=1 Tax=Pseudobacter ginsenosidimutans TaxID=661488 RepID=A0A4Q7N4V1_9BACT|nr:hypothetical protein [Pseudobacter ginsenosidimutans]QEC44567.1 hypothetical protein FSB84_23885 [Pseudobacter ginsenosidimutans]RZS76045.1 hypothetical protein EV199_1922 [Pseudobacter ginsenosidimutans]
MSASKLKGSLLEYIVRKLLSNCGFGRVRPDGLFIFQQRGLNFINGKGAAHDADVLMIPPIQMPFSYPYRINFECKAYNKKTGLTIIRNALGLRYDINEFEIVTRDLIQDRQNNRRSVLAIDNRQRYNYQVGVASIEDFTKDAFEFAANNKIPLISLRWFLPDNICGLFHEITDNYLRQFQQQDLTDLLQFLKGNETENGRNFAEEKDSHFRTILNSFTHFENRVIIGLLESGDMLFLISDEDINRGLLRGNNQLNAQFHYLRGGDAQLDFWTITINQTLKLGFYLPDRIVQMWKEQNFDKQIAINIKEELFSKVFIFIQNNNSLPFRIVNIDREWLNSIGWGRIE